MSGRRPPPSLRILARLFSGTLGENFVDEVEEEYHEIRARRGALAARLWLGTQLIRPDTVRLLRLVRARSRRSAPWSTVRSPGSRPLARGGVALRQAVRSLRRRPGLGLAIVATLALGIGANTAVFSVIDGVLLEPLPYPDGDRLVFVWAQTRDDVSELLSGPQAAEVAELEAFERSAQIFGFGATSMRRTGVPEPLRTLTVSHDFFDLFGVEPSLGRVFLPEDEFKLTNEQIRDPEFERPVGAMVLSHAFWERAFGGDAEVLGTIVRVSGHRHRIVGVMPSGFRAHLPGELRETEPADVWIMSPFDQPSFPRDTRFVRVVGLAPPDAGLEQIQGALDRLASWQRATFQEDARDEITFRAAWLQDEVGRTAESELVILLAAVGFVLLIACANVATLLLVRATDRDAELQLRRALGASRGELAWASAAESLVASSAGGFLGVALAPALTHVLVRLAPADLPRADAIEVDASVLAFTGTLTLVVALLSGTLPALRAVASKGLGGMDRWATGMRGGGIGQMLATVEIALAVILMVGTALLLQSFGNVFRVDPGLETAGVHAWEANLTTPTHPTWKSRVDYFRSTQEALLAEPDVRAVGILTPVPFDGADRVDVRVAGSEADPTIVADLRRTGPGALELLGIDLLRGRFLEWADLEDFDRLHAVVDERFAQTAWPDGEPLGQTIGVVRREYGPESQVWDEWKDVEVVGVVRSVRGRDVRVVDPPTVYVTYSQNMWGRPAFLAKVDGRPDPARIRSVAAGVDPRPLLSDFTSLHDVRETRVAPLRFALTLIGLFGALGLALAATGVYAVLAYGVRSRERELNIRTALGAGSSELFRSVLRSGLAVGGVGVAVGVLVATRLAGFLESHLFGITPADPLTYASVGVFLLLVAALASSFPARQALRRDPVDVLR